MALRHLVMVEIVEEVMAVAIREVDIGIIIEALLKDHMAAAIEGIVDQEDLLGNEVVHHTMGEVIGIEIEREEDHEVVVLIIIEGEVDIDLMYRK